MKAFFIGVLIFFLGLTSFADWNLEQRKINFLLNSIEHLDAIFIRNGQEYSASEAARHLRMKVDAAFSSDPSETGQATVEMFIEQIASKSFFTGKPYYIRFPNGSTLTAREWLYQQLQFFH